MIKAECYTCNGFAVFDNHVKSVFIVHDSSKAHDGNVDVIFRFPHLPNEAIGTLVGVVNELIRAVL